MSFDQWTSLAESAKGCTVALAGADDTAALSAVGAALNAGVDFLLVGDADRIRSAGKATGVDIRGATLVPTENGSLEERDICTTAARLCAAGRADVLMKGRVGTAAFTRAVLDRENQLTDAGALLSHVGLFSDPRNSQPFVITDAAININPDVEVKKIILMNAVAVVRALGITAPKIALLAPVEKVVSKIASTVDAALLREWVLDGALGDAVADGPFSLDVAASASAARIKGLESPVAGRADIYLAPNLDSGNMLYKSLTVFAGALAASTLTGATVPVVLTSRSDSDAVKQASLGLALHIVAGQ